MPMAKELFKEWRRTREKLYRRAGCDEDSLLWRAFRDGFYASKKLDQDRMFPNQLSPQLATQIREVKNDQTTTEEEEQEGSHEEEGSQDHWQGSQDHW